MKAPDSTDVETFAAPMEHGCVGLRIVRAKGPQGAQIGRMHSVGVLHFERVEAVSPVHDEVHLHPASGSPVVQGRVIRRIRRPGPQVLGHESFQRLTVDLTGPVERAGGTQRPEDAGVEQIELVPDHGRPPGALAEDRAAETPSTGLSSIATYASNTSSSTLRSPWPPIARFNRLPCERRANPPAGRGAAPGARPDGDRSPRGRDPGLSAVENQG